MSSLLPNDAALSQRAWSWLLRNVILPGGDVAAGQSLMPRLRLIEDAQWWDRARLTAYRDRALRDLIQVAYNEVPFYRRLLDEAAVSSLLMLRPANRVLKKCDGVLAAILGKAPHVGT